MSPPAPHVLTTDYALVWAGRRWTIPVRQSAERKMVPLDRLTSIFGLSFVDDPNVDLTIRAGSMDIQLAVGQPFAGVGRRIVSLSSPIERDGTTWLVPIGLLSGAIGPAIGQRIQIRPESALIVVEAR